ncbi:hypothetical protein RUM44_001240 [Polyplax serrata]
MLSLKHTPRPVTVLSSFSSFHKYILQTYNNRLHKVRKRLPVVFGRSVDTALQHLLDLVIRDLVSPWMEDLSLSSKDLQYSIKKEIWYALGKLNKCLINVDETKLIAVDMVIKITSHFEKIRLVQSGGDTTSEFYVSHHLMNPEKEINYLRKISEFLLLSLFSKNLISHTCNKNLLIELLACKVFLPCITLLTDPDYINLKILEYMEQIVQTHNHEILKAESFCDFLHVINTTKDVNYLKHIRYSIMTEIMQATTIQNLKNAKDVDSENQAIVKEVNEYLGQLKYAKMKCEDSLRNLGCPGFTAELEDSPASVVEKRVLPFEKVLEHSFGRKMLYQFLENGGQESFLAYWTAVEKLRTTKKENWHQVGAEIYYTFINSPTATIKVEKSVRRRIESFLLGNSGPEAFYEVQGNIVQLLKERVYLNFILTDFYTQFVQQYDSLNHDVDNENQCLESKEFESALEQPGYAKNKLNQLQEKLNNKSQALQALRLSLKPESKVLSGLEKEVESLEGEKRELEVHLVRTEVWEQHLGKWRAVVQSAETSDDKEVPHFVLVVHVAEDDRNADYVSMGWVVLRKLSEFYDLHRKLTQVWSGVKQLELPSQSSKFIFGKQSDKQNLEKAKLLIQKYLEFVLQDERLNTSEALYTFLSPSSEHLKIPNNCGIASPKKNRFSLSTLFKSSSNQGYGENSRESDDEDYSLLKEADVKSGEGKDAVAEPLYALLGEIFDLRGVFRWLRKTLITFVQITYGRTISRQVGETVAWVFSEEMVHYYITVFIQSWWPNGTLAKQQHSRTKEEKLKTRIDAKNKFINNTPEVLNNLVGQQNARRGAIKIFETLQDVRLNKQLIYDMLEILISELFPEVRAKITPKT